MKDEVIALETIIEDLRKYAEWLEESYIGELTLHDALTMPPDDMRAGMRADRDVSELWPGESARITATPNTRLTILANARPKMRAELFAELIEQCVFEARGATNPALAGAWAGKARWLESLAQKDKECGV